MGVAIVVAPDAAELAATQHAAWMLVNLLARADGVVSAVRIVCPADIPLAGRVVPLAARNMQLQDALVRGGQAIGVVATELVDRPEPDDLVRIVGAMARTATMRDARYVFGDGWWGGVGDEAPAYEPTSSSLPFGPYVAACLAASEIFLAVRLPESARRHVDAVAWDCWTQRLTRLPAANSPTELMDSHLPRTALAGVGAVGTAWVHAIWTIDGIDGSVILTDPDPMGIEKPNLNRYVLFGLDTLGRLKASEAAKLTSDACVVWEPHDGPFEELALTPDLLLSAVDRNRSRAALQARYAPLAISASTRDLRAEVLRIGSPGIGACLRCYNPPEPVLGDDDLRQRLLADGDDAIHRLAVQTAVGDDEVRRWLRRPRCDEVGDRLLETLRASEDGERPNRFAVGFTSVMAGTLMAAETVKLCLGQSLSADQPDANNVTFQFLRPIADTNAAARLLRDPSCPACAPENPAANLWLRRYEVALSVVSGLDQR